MQFELCLVAVYWSIALVASGLYGWHAVTIFIQPLQPGEPARPRPWMWHQRWLNFVGSFVGWIALWPLARSFGSCLFSSCNADFGLVDAILALVAFIGITGHLPSTIVSLVMGIGGLAGKLAEAIATWVAKK